MPDLSAQIFFVKPNYLKFILGYVVLTSVGLSYVIATLSNQLICLMVAYNLCDVTTSVILAVSALLGIVFIGLASVSNWRFFILEKLVSYFKANIDFFFFVTLFLVT